jgi:predicted nucleic acid-binding protein
MLPNRAVVDASVAYKWLVWEENSERANRLQEARLLAPELFDAECTNILWRKARQQMISREDAVAGVVRLTRMPVIRISHSELLERALTIAFELDHPAYDCLYLAVADQQRIPLVTADRRLLSAAGRHARYADQVVPLSSIPLN